METTPIIDYNTPSYGSKDSPPTNVAKLNIVNLSYTVKERKGPWYKGMCFRPWVSKKVLKNVDMSINSGQVTAILGSSGSGKTSLLDVISDRHDGEISGNIYYKDTIWKKKDMLSWTSYVMQADRLLTHLTVRECLRYAGNFCLPSNTSAAEIESKVENVIRKMGLIKVADSIIGGEVVRGLSGGEQRRVSVALQLLKDPEILLLDEPTTGLDSFTARYLVKNLHDLSRTGKLVLMTIHQPRSDIFKYFDQVTIMCQGELAYYGPADEIVPHFTRLNFPCPVYANPLDNYIDVCSIDRKTKQKEEDTTKRVQDLIQAYRDSPQHDAMVASMTDSLKLHHYGKGDNPRNGNSKAPGNFKVLKALLGRMNTNLFRDKNTLITRIVSTPFTLIFIVILLGRIGNDQNSVRDRAGLIYQAIIGAHVEGFLINLFLFPNIRNLFYREARDGYYNWWQFLSCYTVHTLPFHFIATVIYTSMVYWICGLYDDFGLYCEYVAVSLVLAMIIEGMMLLMLRVIFNFQVVNMMMTMYTMISVTVAGGIFRKFDDLPKVLQWFTYITPVKYGTEIVMTNEYTHVNITCDPNEQCFFPSSEAFLDATFPHAVHHHDQNYGWLMLILCIVYIVTGIVYKVKKIPNLH